MRRYVQGFIIVIFAIALVFVTLEFRSYYYTLQKESIYRFIQRSLSLCYAQEGFYPASLNYLEKYYGLRVDTNLYLIRYKAFASNIRPEVEIYRIGSSR
jgi:hypothetical protein